MRAPYDARQVFAMDPTVIDMMADSIEHDTPVTHELPL